MERDAIDALTAGDTCTLADGRRFRLELEPDCESITDISDFGECYGRTEWTRNTDYGPRRPFDFSGNAEIMVRDHGSSLWWEPYDIGDIPNGRAGKEFADYRQNVRDILEFGFYVARLEQLTGSDAYGRPIVTAFATLGGIEPFPDTDYLKEIAGELFEEIQYQAKELEQ